MNTNTCFLLFSFIVGATHAEPLNPAALSGSDWSSIQKVYDASRHEFYHEPDGSLHAHNPGQKWVAKFDGQGFTVCPVNGDWQWGLELVTDSPLKAEQGPFISLNQRARVTKRVTENLEEWYVNDTRGLEQGWTVKHRPADLAGALKLELRVRGGLKPVVSAQSISFNDSAERCLLTYSGLKAWDARGRVLETCFIPKADHFMIVVKEEGAVYPITIDPVARLNYLKADSIDASDKFGSSVAISGDTAVVGVHLEDSSSRVINGNSADNLRSNSGAAYVFTRSIFGWTKQAYLKASNADANDQFGYSVAISGDTIVVGSVLESSSATGVNGDQASNVATNAGAAYVFVRSGGAWTQQAYLKASNTGSGDVFGAAVAISDNTIVVTATAEASGIPGNQADNSRAGAGAAYAFVRKGSVWSQQAYLKADNVVEGPELGAAFGFSVAAFGNTIVVGAYGDDINDDIAGIVDAGLVFVYERVGSTWGSAVILSAEAGSGAGDRFGHSVTISGDNIAVGATYESSNAIGTGGDDTNDLAFRAGAVYVFGRNGSSWLRTAYLKASNTEASDEFGFSVSMDGGILLVGAFGEDSAALDIDGLQTNGAAESGAAYLFTKYGSTWVQKSYIKASNTNASDRFGNSVALSGGYFIVGAVGEASATDDPANNAAVNAGAAYTYTAQPGIFSICKSGLSASGGVDLAFSTLGQSAIGNFVFSEVGLQGTGASGGRNRALYGFGTSGPFSASVLQSGASLAGLTGLPAGSKLSAVFGPVSNELPLGSALFQGTVTGPGLSSSNNRILFGFDGELKALCRTGVAVPELSAAKPKTYQDVIHSRNGGIGLSYLLSSGAGVTSSNDSGILGLAPNGSVVDSSAREGQIAFGGGGNFGQFSGRAVAVATSDDLYFIAKFIPTGSAPVDALFKMGFFDIDSRSTPLQGQLAGGVSAGERYGAFTGATSFVLGALLRATLTSSPVSSNEGVWTDAGVLRLRKGQTLEPGVNIAKILRVWGLNSGQIIAQVMLSGTAVTSSNNQALILRQLVGVNPIYLMRTGSPAPGIGLASVTVASIQAVDVHPSGDYAVLGSLKGGLAAANQVLWTGDTSLGNDTTLSHLRLPQKRLRKGDRYTSSIGSFLPITANDIIRSIALKTALDASGVGARGLAQQIDEMGLVVLTLTGDRKIQELVLLFP